MAEIERGGFRPTASPRDTVAIQQRFITGVMPVGPVKGPAPAAPQMPRPPAKGPSALAQLGEALSAMNPKITAALDQHYKGEQEKDGLDAELRAMRDNMTSWGEAVKADPTLADRSPYFRQIYEGRAARTLVQKKSGELLAEYYSSPIAGSDDPGAINKWLADRMQTTIDAADSPASRVAMIEETRKLAAQFQSAHRENAVRNLLQKNVDSVGVSIAASIDNHQATGGNYSGGATTDYYRALKGAESEGGKNIGNRAGTSTAFGPYQFTKGTWERMVKNRPELGLTVAGRMDPAQQERAIQAFTKENADALNRAGILVNDKNLYMSHFLGQAGGVRFLKNLQANPNGAAVLSAGADQVAANRSVFYDKGGRARTNVEVFARMTGKFGQGQTFDVSATTGEAPSNGGIEGLTKVVQDLSANGRAQGLTADKINSLEIKAVTQAAIKHGDENLLEVLNKPRADGTPGSGMTLEGRQMVEQARHNILNNRVREENALHTKQQRQQEEMKKQVGGEMMDVMMNQIEAGQQPRFTPDFIRKAGKVDPDLAEKALAIQKNAENFDQTEDRMAVAGLSTRIYSGMGTPTDVMNAVASGLLKNPSTIKNLMEEGRRNADKLFTSNPIVKDGADQLAKLVGEPFETGVLGNPERAFKAVAMYRRSVLNFKEKNPNASEADIFEYGTGEVERIAKFYKPDSTLDQFDPKTIEEGRKGSTSSDPRKPGAVTAPRQTLVPREGVEWRKTAVFSDPKTLDAELSAWRAGERDNTFGQWISKLGLTSPAAVKEFIEKQRSLSTTSKR